MYRRFESTEEVILFFVLFFVFMGFLILCCFLSHKNLNKRWNNGFCECGGKWEYVQAVGHQVSTGYIYECSNCGNICEFDEKR